MDNCNCIEVGLEMELMRASSDGRFVRTPHPFSADDEYIQRDFCENQIEFITSPHYSTAALVGQLDMLQRRAAAAAAADEMLWLCSNPPRFDTQADILPAQFTGDLRHKTDYRLFLARRYGKRQMLYSGVHLNLSALDDFIGSRDRNTMYLRIAKQFVRCGWLIVLLTAASPVFDLSLLYDGGIGAGFDGFSSRRQGVYGYWNHFAPVLDFTSVSAYADSIRAYVQNGALCAPEELYTSVRLKPRGAYSLDLLENSGINHIELRMLDVNPLYKNGINPADIDFIKCLFVYLSSLDDFDLSADEQLAALENHKNAALFDTDNVYINGIPIKNAARTFLNDMLKFDGINEAAVRAQLSKLDNNADYAHRIKTAAGGDFIGSMIKISKEAKARLLRTDI